ncbi:MULTISPECIES: RuBisCO large subunit C-terminal-like domain-containing protein [unclassified Pseudomonas]|uniref:RuBisCO large subunit C-terminal-like domain-containing protein n=1 Tax=unclassified Pseudomonas TaxID=196821 RepID=UPI001B3359EF|nr:MULTISPECIES: RuBisCO large subunit C-terminal-like domain-containing protein [unclassified Pseudomonas]MBP5943226.1 hypothetical protein [Pseudomonas sp. P9(2020)]MBZ9562142.1 hypothetical protein [Pseudomonas sp. P116]
MSRITINGLIELSDESNNTIESIFLSIRQNILAGSFDSYSKKIIDRLSIDIQNTLDPRRLENKFTHIRDKEYFFELSIPSRYFPIDSGGDTHLVDSIVGDMFSLSNSSIKRIFINDVQWQELEHGLALKRTQPYSIRNRFKLDHFTPLLGFSVKPRLGLSNEDFKNQCIDAARLGFNIIEPDTRKMLLNEHDLDWHIDLASQVAEFHKPRGNISSYSVNLSNYSGNLERAIEKLSKAVSNHPITVKIDAGLDAISKIKKVKEVNAQIIITSYPLIKKALSQRIPDVFFDKYLSHCGIDIMYPGGFVALPGNKRHYNATEDITLLAESINRYTSHIHKSHFIPTISGGISTGLLHLYYELYGPKVSLFLGGAVATNKNGVEAGAELCMKVLDYAIGCRKKLASHNQKLSNKKNKAMYKTLMDLPLLDARTVKQIKDETDSEYIIPREFMTTNKLSNFTEANWNYWTADNFEFI